MVTKSPLSADNCPKLREKGILTSYLLSLCIWGVKLKWFRFENLECLLEALGHVRAVQSDGHWSVLLAFGLCTVGIRAPAWFAAGLCPWALSWWHCWNLGHTLSLVLGIPTWIPWGRADGWPSLPGTQEQGQQEGAAGPAVTSSAELCWPQPRGEGSLPCSEPPGQQGQRCPSCLATTRAPQQSPECCQGFFWMWGEPVQVEQPQGQSGWVELSQQLWEPGQNHSALCLRSVWRFCGFIFVLLIQFATEQSLIWLIWVWR